MLGENQLKVDRLLLYCQYQLYIVTTCQPLNRQRRYVVMEARIERGHDSVCLLYRRTESAQLHATQKYYPPPTLSISNDCQYFAC